MTLSTEVPDAIGASFTAPTVSVKLRLLERAPSVAVTVMVTTPKAFATGVIDSERFVSLPLKTRPPGATTEASLLVAVSTTLAT
jgi:hypothetical protein